MKENERKCFKCGSSPAEDPNITLHRFPKPGRTNILRCELWAKYCFPHDSWSSPDFQNQLFSKHYMLCNKHFKKSSFIDYSEKRLFKSAAPDEECDKIASTEPLLKHSNKPIAAPSETRQPLSEVSKNIPISDKIASTEPLLKHSNKPIAAPSETRQPLSEVSKNTPISDKITPSEAVLVHNVFEPIAGSSETKTQVSAMEYGILPEKNKLVVGAKLHNMKQTEKCQKMLKKMKYQMKKINRLQKTIKHLKNEEFLKVLSQNDLVSKILNNKISSSFALLLQGQLQNYKRKSKGRRWNTECKIIALRLYKRSPRCYKLLRRLICLPAPSSLKSLLNMFHMKVGINHQIFNVLKKSIRHQSPSENHYILMFDEMSIKKNLFYNKKEDIIEGFQDHALQGRSPQLATHALVFMIGNIRKKLKQPIAYYISSGSVTADRLSVLIKEVLQHCFEAGVNISASVCDLDGVNKRALGILGASAEKPYIIFNDREVVTLFDTPHLLKCFRNMFLKYDIRCPTNITSNDNIGIGVAKWSHIKEFYDLDNNNPNFVFAPCLKEEHLNPNTKQKMKVNLAAQVLSHSVAGGIFSKISDGLIGLEAVTTANLITNIDNLFDCVNANTPDLRRGKKYSTNITNDSPHFTHFSYMKNFFKEMAFLGCRRTPPSQEGWIWSINAIERVWKNLSKHKRIKSLATRRLQQDPLENLFGCIRANCGCNTNPTVGQFVAGLKTAVLSNLSSIGSGNCENDEDEAIISNFKILLSPPTDMHTAYAEATTSYCDELEEAISSTFEYSTDESSGETQACAYVCGFIIKKSPTILCENCKKMFVSESLENVHIFMEFKEYSDVKRSLMYASKKLIECVERGATIINIFLQKEAHKKNIKGSVEFLFKNSINFEFLNDCVEHKNVNINYLFNSVFHICIKRFCILKNRQFAQEYSASALKKKIGTLQGN